ncbi:MAG: hypothetical protein ACT4PW_02660 [Acidimicrobiia bacterium]
MRDKAKDAVGDAAAQGAEVAAVVGEEAKAVAGTSLSEARSVVATSKAEAGAVATGAKQHARDLVVETRSQLKEQAENQTVSVANQIGLLGDQLQAMAEGRQAEGPMVDLARQAAEAAQRVARRVEQGGVDELMSDVKQLARTRPALFLLGAAGAGFAMGRLAKNADTQALVTAAKPVAGQTPATS